jgi:hypothetical protein
MRRHGDCRYEVHQVFLSSADKELASQTSTRFTVTLPTELKRAVAIRPLHAVFYEDTTMVAQVELGGALLPVRIFTGDGLFLNLNNYDHIRHAKSKNYPVFTRIQGEEVYPAVGGGDFWTDPYTHILNPSDPKLKRFELTLYDMATMDVYTPATPANSSFNITLAVYCEKSNCDLLPC